MGTESLKRTLAGDEGTNGKSNKGNHSKTAILHFLHSHLGGVHARRVKGESIEETAGLGLLPSLVAFELKEADNQELKSSEGVVREPVLLSTSLKPLGLAKSFGDEDTGDSHHGPATVGLLGFSIPGEALRVSSKAQGVKSIVWNKVKKVLKIRKRLLVE